MNKSLLIIISGPSGVGKTTIALELVTYLNSFFPTEKIVTYTTRQPRTNEKQGIDYEFVTTETFEKLLEQDFFFEHTTYNSHFYGTPNTFKEKLKSGISCVEVTDYTVGQHIKNSLPETLLFWIQPPSLEILKKRLNQRKTESLDKIEKRIKIASQELTYEDENHFFDFHIVNDDLSSCLEKIKVIVLEKYRQ